MVRTGHLSPDSKIGGVGGKDLSTFVLQAQTLPGAAKALRYSFRTNFVRDRKKLERLRACFMQLKSKWSVRRATPESCVCEELQSFRGRAQPSHPCKCLPASSLERFSRDAELTSAASCASRMFCARAQQTPRTSQRTVG